MKERAPTGTREKLQKDLQALLRDTRDLLRSTAGTVGEEAKEIRGRVEQRLDNFQQVLQQKGQAAEEMLKEGLEATDEAVHRYPYQAMGISLLAGVMLGLLFFRRRD